VSQRNIQALLSLGAWGSGYSLAIVPKIQPVVQNKPTDGRKTEMKDKLLKFTTRMRILLHEEAQDLIEYALVVALVALAATAGMNSLATAINTAFSGIGTTLTTYVS
jgi:pilus assembly protein Flp/PilA